MSYDFLNSDKITTNKSFQPPEPEFRLKQYSSKLPVSSRLFPEWAVAVYGVLKTKYPNITISSMSELIALTLQDYINDNYKLVDEQLPPTEDSLDFLIKAGFINPQSKRQFKHISQANQKVSEYEAEAMSSGSLKQKYEYYKNRDPDKAEEIMEKMVQEFSEGMGQPAEEKQETTTGNPSQESLAQDNRSLGNDKPAEKDNDGIASLDYLDDVPTADSKENQ